ncbi:uncharacterized protein BT62DRAFT_923045 [Guyanagaster necrorhizus]|uniref:Uncharacterized protein n=1 Tax=Guyanagaster necrorhizus TaxID=856835 RepID=A0A9P7VJS3_9AGAR|nr:uncharacterized protein BT62DRAFT_923045 [Guyanagaster necrorhizus MCA 3950]KAG7441820.1 hypothetical protein BT62DRAFT_923045 [Guyanagaster necrorhizus MCA 3950]
MSPVATKRVHWEDDSSRYAAPSPFYVTLLPGPPHLHDIAYLPLLAHVCGHRRPSLSSPRKGARTDPPLACSYLVPPIDFFSSSRIVPHPHVASDPASNPPLGRVYILVEIDKVERFNVEVHAASGGIVTVHDVIARMQSVLRERLKPEVVGGCYKEGCGCGCGTLVDKRSHFTTMFDGLSVRLRSNGEENKWRMHLRRMPTQHHRMHRPKTPKRPCRLLSNNELSLGTPWVRTFEYVTRSAGRGLQQQHLHTIITVKRSCVRRAGKPQTAQLTAISVNRCRIIPSNRDRRTGCNETEAYGWTGRTLTPYMYGQNVAFLFCLGAQLPRYNDENQRTGYQPMFSENGATAKMAVQYAVGIKLHSHQGRIRRRSPSVAWPSLGMVEW